ncbi:hypothetical protein AVEN_58086-1, partial [Araneus ventricosus]
MFCEDRVCSAKYQSVELLLESEKYDEATDI